jgi:hypothetical protein
MTVTTYYGPHTTVSETCLWVADGTRRICVTYFYDTTSGVLKYAASVFRCSRCDGCESVVEPTEQEMFDNAHTTTRRFELRPVVIMVQTELCYGDIIATIRHEMCHGYGCKGPRRLAAAFDMECASSDGGDSVSSANTWVSDEDRDDGFINLGDYRKSIYGDGDFVPPCITWAHLCKDDIPAGSTVKMNTLSNSCMTGWGPTDASVTDTDTGETFTSLNQWAKSNRGQMEEGDVFDKCSINTDCDYVFNKCSIKVPATCEDYEPIGGMFQLHRKTVRTLRYFTTDRNGICREYYIAFKADKKTGDLIYGAAISRRAEKMGPITDERLIEGHFTTAMARLERYPVLMVVSEEARDQLKSKASHREDVMYEIVAKIESRPGGKYLIRAEY